MIGTGVFTSLGFQLSGVSNTYSIIILWATGAAISFFGALSYAELATAFNENGGEYIFLSKLYHPFVGYFAGIISIIVGFAAPVALAAMALAAYLKPVIDIPGQIIAISVIILISIAHSFNTRRSEKFQNFTTLFKLFVIGLFICAGFIAKSNYNSISTTTSIWKELASGSFATSLIYVTYSYSGWNAAAYITTDIENARKQLPKVLLASSLIVGLIYILIQIVILKNASYSQLNGKIEVAFIAATNIAGSKGGNIFLVFLAFILISSISAMIWVGSRVSNAVAKDYAVLKALRPLNESFVPVRCIWFQAGLSIAFVLTNSFQTVLTNSGLALQLCLILTVSGLFIVRKKNIATSRYKSPFYPFAQIAFILISTWIVGFLLFTQTTSVFFLATLLLITAISYRINKTLKK